MFHLQTPILVYARHKGADHDKGKKNCSVGYTKSMVHAESDWPDAKKRERKKQEKKRIRRTFQNSRDDKSKRHRGING